MNETWPDGTSKSSNNGFTHGYGTKPHGYTPGSQVLRSPGLSRRGQGGGYGKTGGPMPGVRGDNQNYSIKPRNK